MLIMSHYLQEAINRISNIKTTLSSKRKLSEDDIDSFRTSMYGHGLDILNSCEEAIFGLQDQYLGSDTYNFINIKNSIISFIAKIKKTEDKEEIANHIEDFLSTTKDINFGDISEYSYRSTFKDSFSYHGVKQIDDAFLSMLGRRFLLNKPRKVNVFNPYATCSSMRWIKSSLENVTTYAANVPETKYSMTKEVFDKVALGNMSGGVISNNAFDIMFLQPKITLTKTSERNIAREEKDNLRDCIKYLRPGGYLVYVIPYFKFYKDICISLSKYFSNIQVRKFTSTAFDESGSVILTAKRNSLDNNKDVDLESYKKLRNINNIKSIDDILDKEFEEMVLPEDYSQVKMFRGSILSNIELSEMLSNSNCKQQFFKKQEVERLSEYPKNPLLPFSTGQLGLVLTSGCLDGIVDEGNGYFHVVKGRVVKKTDENRDLVSANEMELTETTSNRVEINILLPNGVHKILA